MRFFPYQPFELLSSLSAPDALLRLKDAVESKRYFRFGAGGRPFEGEVAGSTFTIQRIITYRNSFLPQVRGTIEPYALGGSRITGTMTLHPFVWIIMAVWFGGLSLMGSAFLAARVKGTAVGWEVMIVPAMLVFAWLLVTVSFRLEVKKARLLLCERLSASEPTGGELGFR